MIKIIDSIMGSGKTSHIIQVIKDNPNGKYIYITPYLAEVQRLQDNCPGFVEPAANKQTGETKLYDLNRLLEQGKNIASTHALFKLTDKYTLQALQKHNYTLIMDEVLEVVTTEGFKKDDLPSILKLELAHIDKDTGYLVWDKEDYSGAYDRVRKLCKTKSVAVVDNKVLVWTFPSIIFNYFKETYVCTYMFNVSVFKYYLDLNELTYDKYSVVKDNDSYCLSDYNPNEDKSNFKINIYTGKKNDIGTYTKEGRKGFSLLCGKWFEGANGDKLKELKNNMVTYFKHDLNNSPSDNNLWTCVLGNNDKFKKALSASPYTKGFAPCNCRATNEYRNKTAVAYIPNRFMDVYTQKFFQTNGISITRDDNRHWGLSEMLQFIWRSAIRDSKEINLYVPSMRMRHALQEWLGVPKAD
ncbi:DEAD/DEAH box helicase family protein [Sporomusa aerivorans]|uniref:DEAD/DEAH box helicase family protein n=1 Tax=Sporomusa aerivorans TaxID=204936 RepID=UPI00352B15CA